MIKKREYYPTSSYDEPGLTTLTHKIRIYPNKTNQDKLFKYFHYRRYCYNNAVVTQRRLYKAYREAKASGKYTQKELNKQFYPNDRRVRDRMVQLRDPRPPRDRRQILHTRVIPLNRSLNPLLILELPTNQART